LDYLFVYKISSHYQTHQNRHQYESTIQGAITIKGIKDEDLPDYLKTTNMLRGTKSLNNFIQNVTGKSEYILENYNLIKKYTTLSHPLDDVLDWNQ
jgi:hypothetical protein